ncbi:MAG: ribonuclease P protein component [Candidatus Parcubacteria bacterium]|nr:ribonuclease P protein component [Candidatus Parcubacteria bacterium]
MLPKKTRVNTREIDRIFKDGKFITSPSLTFKFILNYTSTSTPSRISFIAPKSIAKLAVKRNLLRRRGYRALAKYIDQFPLGLIGAFVFKKMEEDISIIENEIEKILHRLD